ncbi:hypothetical protein [Methanobrevibacter filiformis]|uniref:Uncharacterized protein n=1 Tax=Methanobrevibacter filiformis TaxID=55758 RepID=A0A166DBT1_9EURY|nr:hypothetical protein [Methanobrevibacter filiformis]KZX15422.1 hypothetical protein MBFIL_06410 [Methanobrevibacter filiformis]
MHSQNNDKKIIKKFNESESLVINEFDKSGIISFAQKDVSNSFLRGTSNDFIEESTLYWTMKFNKYANDFFKKLTSDKYNFNQGMLKVFKNDMYEENNSKNYLLINSADDIKEMTNCHLIPILKNIIHAPKEDMGLLAESLVHMTLLKRKFSIDQEETVGGAIVVVIISKSDGFIWKEKKQYYSNESNKHLEYVNYYKSQ